VGLFLSVVCSCSIIFYTSKLMIESSKVVFFSFFFIKSGAGEMGFFGRTIFAKPFLFVVDVVVGCIHF
jgi:hypothetical protein